MSTLNLSDLFNPESIAIVGASERKGSVGSTITSNIINCGFEGKIYPVNSRYKNIMGLPTFPNVEDVIEKIDLAVIATPIRSIPAIMDSCGEKGIKGAVIVSAGGKETGDKGRQIEADIQKAAEKSRVRIIGPNCVGIINTQNKLNASFMHQFPLPGKTAFISQSGAICTSVMDLAMRENIGFSHFVSIGSMLDVDFADMIDYLGSLKEVESIVMYMENITHIRNFMSAARAVSRIKPIIALKSGRSEAGARAAASHTGAMAGVDSVYDAALERAGILRANTFEELFDCAEFLAKQSRPRGGKLAIITNAGGPGVMAADALASYNLEPAALERDTIQKLDNQLQKEWSRSNPIDILGDASPKQYLETAEICSNAPEIDGLLLLCSPVGTFDSVVLAEPLADFIKKSKCPVFTSWIGGTNMDKAKAIFNEKGIITYDTPERAVRAFANLYQYGLNIKTLHEIPVRKDINLKIDKTAAQNIIERSLQSSKNKGVMTEVEAKVLLSSYGIPVNRTELATTEQEAAELAEAVGFPAALKICSKDILHKSDSGGVILNLSDSEMVKTAFTTIMKKAEAGFPNAEIDGISVQAMASGADYELIFGVKKDKDFGPVILFGAGGVMTEIFNDTAIALPPLNHSLAKKTIEKTKISKVIKGFRNFKKIDQNRLEEILIRLDRLVSDFPQIEELDINPVIVKDGMITGVDARVLVKKTDVVPSAHLIISPYPAWQEAECRTTENENLFIRPIRPGDAHQMIDFFSELSPQTVYLRFFSPIKKLSEAMLIKFTQIDYDREVALIALTDSGHRQKMIGVARVIFTQEGDSGEFAIILADKWQGKGIGSALLKRCLMVSKKYGLKKVYGLVMNGNTQMRSLADKLGFSSRREEGSYDIELEINLDKLDMSDLPLA